MERVPRYTSYPTAPHFHKGIDAKCYANWLNLIEKNQVVSLYFHIPYCRQLCWFCGCHTKVINKYEPIKKYLAILKDEIALLAQHLPKVRVVHIHFGGGSPNIINAEDFTDLMHEIHNNFTIAEKAEIAVEIDPRTVNDAQINAYRAAKVTRASIGVQDFNLKVQAAINRIQPYNLVQNIINKLRKAGINAINIDLIYGLPHQTLATIEKTIAQTISLEPNRISLFGYAHVPWMKKHQQLVPENHLPDKNMRMGIFDKATFLLQEATYQAIGLDHFAKADDTLSFAMRQKTLQRNFQGYTTDMADVLLGLGVSSISSLPQGYGQNTSSIIDYIKSIKERKLPTIRGIELKEDDRKRRAIIMSLMCHMSAHIPQSHYMAEITKLKPYFNAGEITYENEILRVSPKAKQHLRLIASVFDRYLSTTTQLYSQAV